MISSFFGHEKDDTKKEHKIIQEQDHEPFKYSIKSTSKRRFTHPEEYEAQMRWGLSEETIERMTKLLAYKNNVGVHYRLSDDVHPKQSNRSIKSININQQAKNILKSKKPNIIVYQNGKRVNKKKGPTIHVQTAIDNADKNVQRAQDEDYMFGDISFW
jgi:hypothetical protein